MVMYEDILIATYAKNMALKENQIGRSMNKID